MLRSLTLSTAISGTALSACDSIVATDYQGESRLTMKMNVENGKTSSADPLVPALAYIDGERLRFIAVDERGKFPGSFRVNVYDAPKGTVTPLDPVLSPDSRVVLQYLAAIRENQLDMVVDLTPEEPPEYEECWNGSCDQLPGSFEVLERQAVEREAKLQASLTVPSIDIFGFSLEFVVLYVREALPPRSWAAARLGAPDGLRAGYHLAELRSLSPEERAEGSECFARARGQAFEVFQAEHAEQLDVQTLHCFIDDEAACGWDPLPTGDDAKRVAELVARAEVEHDCFLLAADIAIVSDPADATVTVRIGDSDHPTWRPVRTIEKMEMEMEQP